MGFGEAQCSMMAALETAARAHHTEANPEMVSRAMTMTATRLARLPVVTEPLPESTRGRAGEGL